MSNSIVASVYSQIMKEVICSVQNDFEEQGIDLNVLIELEKLWETRIISSNVANFDLLSQEYIQTNPVPSTSNPPDSSKQKPPVKVDNLGELFDKYELPVLPNSAYNKVLSSNPNMYSAANLASIASLQRTNLPMNYLPSSVISNPGLNLPPPQTKNTNNYNNSYLQSTPTQQNFSTLPPSTYYLPQANARSNSTENQALRPPQLDGSDDIILDKPMTGPVENKQLVQQSLVLLPQFDGDDSLVLKAEQAENSEDAINSDLDDSSDEESKENVDDEIEHILLCQYDKVSRTKNRWRVNLKDGIILIDGKEYVFNKSSGEFQW